MYKRPYQDVNKFCGKCKLLQIAHNEQAQGKLTMQTLGDLRVQCTKCRTSYSSTNKGIYKADAILGAYIPPKAKLPPGKGKRSIIPETTIKAILKQIEEGISRREVARRTGLSVSTISRIYKKRQS